MPFESDSSKTTGSQPTPPPVPAPPEVAPSVAAVGDNPPPQIPPAPDIELTTPSPAPEPSRPEEENILNEEIDVMNAPLLLKMLPIHQYRVLTELWHGGSISGIAHHLGLNRSTIYRWMRHDARFIAAMNQTIEFQQQEQNARMSGLLKKSTDNLADAVNHGDLPSSKFVIDRVSKIPRGPLSPRVIAKRIRRRDQKLKDYLNSPDDPPATRVIASTVGEPPKALPPADEKRDPEMPDQPAASAPERQKGEHSPMTPPASEPEIA